MQRRFLNLKSPFCIVYEYVSYELVNDRNLYFGLGFGRKSDFGIGRIPFKFRPKLQFRYKKNRSIDVFFSIFPKKLKSYWKSFLHECRFRAGFGVSQNSKLRFRSFTNLYVFRRFQGLGLMEKVLRFAQYLMITHKWLLIYLFK